MPPKRRGVLPLILGLICMFVLAPGIFFGGVAYGGKGLLNTVREVPTTPPGGTVELGANSTMVIMVDVGAAAGTSFESQTGQPSQACQVVGSDGTTLGMEASGPAFRAAFDGRQYESGGSYTAASAGTYTVTCGSNPAKLLTGDTAAKVGGKTIGVIVGATTSKGTAGGSGIPSSCAA